uniref:Uncharacterized protein n=1 Tax=Arundo donax TaxID=35708 RepID=A0A0A9AJ08_ARUDO
MHCQELSFLFATVPNNRHEIIYPNTDR